MDSMGAKVEVKACAVQGLRLKEKCVHFRGYTLREKHVQYRGYTSRENMHSTEATSERKTNEVQGESLLRLNGKCMQYRG